MILDRGQDREELVRGDDFLLIGQLQIIADFLGDLGLVPPAALKTHRVRFHGPRRCRHVTGVDAAGNEGADLHITDLVVFDGVENGLVDHVDRLLHVALLDVEGGIEEGDLLELPLFAGEVTAGFQLVYALEQRLLHGGILEDHVHLHGIRIDLLDEIGMGKERLDLRAEEIGAVHVRVIEGLEAETVPRSVERMLFPVVNEKGEHAAQPGCGLIPVYDIRLQDDLRIRVRFELAAVILDQIQAELPVIQDLAVKDDQVAAVRTVDRLGAALQVDNAQPAETDPHVIVGKSSLAVRTAVFDDLTHLLHHVLAVVITFPEETYKTTHVKTSNKSR